LGALINAFRKLFDDTTTNNTFLGALVSADRMMGLVEQIRPLEVAVLFFKFEIIVCERQNFDGKTESKCKQICTSDMLPQIRPFHFQTPWGTR
jgi:hypothetical protein